MADTERPFRRRGATLLFVVAWLLTTHTSRADDWPQWRGPLRDGEWRETGIVERLPAELPRVWRTEIGGGFAGPAVVGDRVFVCDRTVATGQVVPESRWNVTDPVNGGERVLCLDAATGRILWKHEYPCRYTISYPAGPRATPTVDNDRVYTLGAMADLFCLDAETGKVLWSKNYVRDFGTPMNMWGMAAAPIVEDDKLIALVGGADGACVVAFRKDTGQEIWRSLESDDPGYSAPIIVDAGGVRQLIVWNPMGLYSLDPANGRIYWQQPFPTRMGHSIATPVFNAGNPRVLISSFFNGSMLMQLDRLSPAASERWRGNSDSELAHRTDGLHSLISTPVIDGDYIYGVCSYGALRCLNAKTGQRIWETHEATGEGRWANAFLVRHQERYLICNEHGELILARLTQEGYEELSRAPLIAPTAVAGRRTIVWSHPALANRRIYARNDREIVCVDLAKHAVPGVRDRSTAGVPSP